MKSLALLCLPVVLLAGCAQMTQPVVVEDGVDTAASQRVLEQVRQDYEAGRYGSVVRTVTRSTDLDGATRATRTEAYKLQAFSYCMRDYRLLCEESFVRALMLQPDFDLADAERGHPQWGPAFEAAQAQVAR